MSTVKLVVNSLRLISQSPNHVNILRSRDKTQPGLALVQYVDISAGFTLWIVLSPLANFTENWPNKNFEFWPIFANFTKIRAEITMANLAKLILMLVGT